MKTNDVGGREMTGCKPLRRDMLPHPVDIKMSDNTVDLSLAEQIAAAKAVELCPEAMLLAWYDQKSGEYSPKIPC